MTVTEYIRAFKYCIIFNKRQGSKKIKDELLFIDSFEEDMILVNELYEAELVFDEEVTIIAENSENRIECCYYVNEPMFIKTIYLDVIGKFVYF